MHGMTANPRKAAREALTKTDDRFPGEILLSSVTVHNADEQTSWH